MRHLEKVVGKQEKTRYIQRGGGIKLGWRMIRLRDGGWICNASRQREVRLG
jgi:hypothetical protein